MMNTKKAHSKSWIIGSGRRQWIAWDGSLRTRKKRRKPTLSDDDKWTIIRRYATGRITQTELAKRYNVCCDIVHALVHGKTWPYIDVITIADAAAFVKIVAALDVVIDKATTKR